MIPRCFGYLCISVVFCFDYDVCLLDLEIITCYFLCADPWGISVMTEDVKGSFDSMNTKEWFFRLKKKEIHNTMYLRQSCDQSMRKILLSVHF